MTDPKPHYHGHRQRLKDRFLETQGQGMADYELLELLLFYHTLRGDTKPLAKDLLGQFNTLPELFNAERVLIENVKGAGPSLSLFLKVVREICLRMMRNDLMRKRTLLATWQQVLDYCTASMAYDQDEQLRLLFLDKKNQLIAEEVQERGTVDHTPLYPRKIIKRALEVGASAIIMVHNHPSGDPTPSRMDIQTTLQVFEAANALGISLHDHLIIGKDGHSSLKSMGLF